MRKTLITIAVLGFAAMPAAAKDPFASALDKAKWQSLGVDKWIEFDPFERALPSRARPNAQEWRIPLSSGPTDQLKALIAFSEAGAKGYDAIHFSARKLPGKKPTQMTLGEIDEWIRATPGQPHAIGRYQFIPSTLRALRQRAGSTLERPGFRLPCRTSLRICF